MLNPDKIWYIEGYHISSFKEKMDVCNKGINGQILYKSYSKTDWESAKNTLRERWVQVDMEARSLIKSNKRFLSPSIVSIWEHLDNEKHPRLFQITDNTRFLESIVSLSIFISRVIYEWNMILQNGIFFFLGLLKAFALMLLALYLIGQATLVYIRTDPVAWNEVNDGCV